MRYNLLLQGLCRVVIREVLFESYSQVAAYGSWILFYLDGNIDPCKIFGYFLMSPAVGSATPFDFQTPLETGNCHVTG